MPLKSSKNQRAFTLVELLVVIGIIAVLIAILLPVLSRVRLMAKSTACASNLHQLLLAANMYANEHKGWLPTASDDRYPGSGFNQYYPYPQASVGLLLVEGYCPNIKVFYWPSNDITPDTPFDPAHGDTWSNQWVPAVPGNAGQFWMTYSYLGGLQRNSAASPDPAANRGGYDDPPNSLDDVATGQPLDIPTRMDVVNSTCPLFADLDDWDSSYYFGWFSCNHTRYGGYCADLGATFGVSNAGADHDSDPQWCNIAYVDGSVQTDRSPVEHLMINLGRSHFYW